MIGNLRANWWIYLALAGFLGYVGPLPDLLRLLNLLFLWPLVLAVRLLLSRDRETEADFPPAPVAEKSRAATAGLSLASLIVMNVWPPSLFRIFQQLVGNLLAASRAVKAPSEYAQKMRYSLPFSGEWSIVNGGPDEKTSHSWSLVSQRYAYDFVISDHGLKRWREGTEGREPGDYLCYGEQILAPADGVVVEARDDIRDARRPGSGWMDPFAADIRGNYVIIEHAEGEYSVVAHLIPASVTVAEGDRVSREQVVGRCGNSGNSSEPHLHFQVQDRVDFFTASGLPISFDDVFVDGNEPDDGLYLVRGTKVRNR